MQVEQKLKKEMEKVKRLEDNLIRRNEELETARVEAQTAAESKTQAQRKACYAFPIEYGLLEVFPWAGQLSELRIGIDLKANLWGLVLGV